jgi:hypothetical protein
MAKQRHLIPAISIVLALLLNTSCTMSKRIYLSNKTDKTVTLVVDSNFEVGEGTMLSDFKTSLNGKRIEPGHITIHFESGKWSKSDEENLKALLLHLDVVKDGTSESFRLPQSLKIGRGIFIQELIVTIIEPQKQ